ncbi:MAG: hypothetical protein IT319_20365 [Anaerolineae bacterium]|nr:hypothetical protein [Anaerolineae bacterium]
MTRLLLCGILTLVLFFALSPGLWYDPLARIQDVIRGRIEVARTQVDDDPRAPTTLEERAAEILAQPFMLPLQHAEIDPVAPQTEIDRYMNSPLSGVQFGAIFGGLLTLLAGFGLLASFVPHLRLAPSRVLPFGLFLWLVVNIVTLMTNPLPWQRYHLTLIPVATLLAGMGLLSLIALIRRAPSAQPRHA